MRKILFLFSIFTVIACSRSEKIKIHGLFSESGEKYLFLDELNIDNTGQIDSVIIEKDGTFTFTFRVSEPSFYQLRVADNNFITLLAEPGEKIRITSSSAFLPEAYTVEGSEGSSLVKELDDRLFATQVKMDSISLIYENNITKPGFDTLQPILDKEYVQIISDQRKANIRFILENIASLASIKALYQKLDSTTYVLYDSKDLQYLKIVADSLKVKYPESKHTRALVTNLENELNRFYSQQINDLINNVDSRNINLALPNLEGDTITLSSLRGKIVLLSFWASWDEASVSENLELKKLYSRYHSKGFEIYQISFDNDREKWETAVQFDELPWINVSDLAYPDSHVLTLFNVQRLPANYLLDSEGVIIGKDFASRSLRIKLGQLFD